MLCPHIMLYESLKSDDKLKPITTIVKGLDIKEVNELLKFESLVDRSKSWGKYIIATLIPTAISILKLVWKV